MKAKFALLVGAAAGYVFGTRAGRERYDQMKGTASELWQNNQIQERVSGAETFVTEKAPDVQAKVSEAAKSAAATAKSKFGRSDGEEIAEEPGPADSDPGR